MRVMVTGSAGFLGSWLTEALLKLGHTVVGVDNFLGCYEDNVVSHANYEFHRADITDLEKMTEIMQNCDVVVHCAAIAVEGLSVFSPVLVTNNIVIGTTVLATAAVRNNVKRFVNCSSMARYGDSTPPFTEDMPARPSDPYGVAKVAAEMQLDLLGKVHGFEVVHCIPHNIIGPRQRYNDPFRNVASIMTNLMLQGRQPIIYGDGNQIRCFSFVQDVLQVLVKLIDCELHEHGEKFNVGPDEEFITINQLAQSLANLLNFSLRIDYHASRPCEVLLAHCSSDKIRKRFNYQTTMSLDDGLKTIIDYVKTRGVREFQYHLPIELHTDKLPRTWRDRLF